MKLLLINPPEHNLLDTEMPEVLEHGLGFTPPLGLLYIAASVKRFTDWDVDVIDAVAEQLDYGQLEKRIKDFQPNAVGVTVMTPLLLDAVKTSQITKEVNSKIKVIWAGPHVCIYPKESMVFDFVDICVVGEGEYAIVELLKSWDEPARFHDIKGLCFKDGKGNITVTLFREPIQDLDAIPHPDRARTKYHLYSSTVARHALVTSMITSRGCPYECVFCDRPNVGKHFRARSANDVVNEIAECLQLGIQEILVYDDTFTVKRERVFEICDEIKRREIRFSWSIRARVDRVDEKMLTALKFAGCERISYGIESGNADILRLLRKGITREQAIETFRLTKKVKIQTIGYFMIGCLGETEVQIAETVAFAKQLDPDYSHFAILVPYPGTPLYRQGLAEGIFPYDYWREFAQNPSRDFMPQLWSRTISKEQLQRLLKKAYRDFYLRPSYLTKRLRGIRSWGELSRKFRAGLSILKAR
jgi:anaerobic magnesium-protoporphyrin IX monomethyl ester cyclase